MRSTLLAVALAAVTFTAAQAAPVSVAKVSVAIGPELAAQAQTYGQGELDSLAAELKGDVEHALSRGGGLSASGGELKLVLVDAKPNRPTFKQLSDRPGLSMMSFSLGGARIEARLVQPDGSAQIGRYAWYETDILLTPHKWTWSDAYWAFEQFADALAHNPDDLLRKESAKTP
ncbi:MAG: hypothetical protein P4L64_09410 [Caulobacteraceae bacterium]|nr:hypothetical protein [Caulobacteraceae bacterium]